MPLIRNGTVSEDAMVFLADDAPAPESGGIIVSLTRWMNERDALSRRAGQVGVRVEPGEDVTSLEADLARLSLVALAFPKFTDGRSYSKARILRERFGFAGEIRAVGQVLRDQLMFMARCGIDSFEVADEAEAARWEALIRAYPGYYQPAGDARPTLWELRRRARKVA